MATATKPRQSGQEGISVFQRILSACSGSLITSLFVTPFDVIRVRLQLQDSLPVIQQSSQPSSTFGFKSYPLPQINPSQFAAADLGVTACCRDVFNLPSTVDYCVASHFDECAVQQYSQRQILRGTWDGFGKIVKNEGASALWRGLSPTLGMSIPSNVIYFVGYDHLRHSIPIENDTLAPLVAGAFARTLATSAISPMELFRTRLQSLASPTRSASNSGNKMPASSREAFATTWDGIKVMVKQQGVASLWRGLTLTLWRDVPFSAVYWAAYENMRTLLNHYNESHQPIGSISSSQSGEVSTFFHAFLSGATAGSIASLVTTPFDVAKTRRQVLRNKNPTLDGMVPMLRNIAEEEGIAGLFKGLVPRMMKVSVSCAIMISFYEAGKRMSVRSPEMFVSNSSATSLSSADADEILVAVENE
ncbi:mitochondrial carrier domain-containing protein [Kockiozyma suomiensis]|uniref:mitochondrial carrier domain-containing protein n=1 Tax=Kockiozyma suomiensis TaxID=1337062 RepID=UPI0033442062